MLVIIELRPLRIETLYLMQGSLWKHVEFETLIQLYFDSQQHVFDIRDLVIQENPYLSDDDQQSIWNAISEFHTSTTNFMRYFLGDKIPQVRYHNLHGTLLSLEYWKSDEIKPHNTYSPHRLGHWPHSQRVQELSRV